MYIFSVKIIIDVLIRPLYNTNNLYHDIFLWIPNIAMSKGLYCKMLLLTVLRLFFSQGPVAFDETGGRVGVTYIEQNFSKFPVDEQT